MNIDFPQPHGYNLKKSLFYGALFFTATGVVTGLIPTPLYVRMVPITFLDYFFLFTTSVLAAVFFGKKKCSITESRLAKIGGVTGFIAFGCPTCNIFLLAFFSTSAIMTYIDPLRPLLGITSTVILILLLVREQIQL